MAESKPSTALVTLAVETPGASVPVGVPVLLHVEMAKRCDYVARPVEGMDTPKDHRWLNFHRPAQFKRGEQVRTQKLHHEMLGTGWVLVEIAKPKAKKTVATAKSKTKTVAGTKTPKAEKPSDELS